ncbi:Universal stress protein UspA [Syntrophobacter sp. SbD1]|nr:Universal stress protein UspA [Syntrophobacter sp. SbD1]
MIEGTGNMKIMLCYDGSDEAKQGVKEAEKRARAFKGEVLAVASHISDDQSYPKRIEPTELGLKEVQAFFDERGIPCKTLLAYRGFDDHAGVHLLLIAEQNKVDEIIVGIRSRSRVGKLLLGSVAQVVLLQAVCPVLGVKKKLKGP